MVHRRQLWKHFPSLRPEILNILQHLLCQLQIKISNAWATIPFFFFFLISSLVKVSMNPGLGIGLLWGGRRVGEKQAELMRFLDRGFWDAETCQLGNMIPEETAASWLRNKGSHGWGCGRRAGSHSSRTELVLQFFLVQACEPPILCSWRKLTWEKLKQQLKCCVSFVLWLG